VRDRFEMALFASRFNTLCNYLFREVPNLQVLFIQQNPEIKTIGKFAFTIPSLKKLYFGYLLFGCDTLQNFGSRTMSFFARINDSMLTILATLNSIIIFIDMLNICRLCRSANVVRDRFEMALFLLLTIRSEGLPMMFSLI
jgi:hypothetical protein